MKINREMVTQAGLRLLNEEGLEQLTLRRLARELAVQAPTIYWHFKSKQELLDEMATTVLGEGAAELLPGRKTGDWRAWATAFGEGLRRILLGYRDGARMISGTRLTNLDYMRTVEGIGSELYAEGFSVRGATVLLSTIYNYTLSFAVEEQAVFPRPGERSATYGMEERDAWLETAKLPFLRRTTGILFDGYDRRFREGLQLIVRGAAPSRPARRERRG